MTDSNAIIDEIAKVAFSNTEVGASLRRHINLLGDRMGIPDDEAGLIRYAEAQMKKAGVMDAAGNVDFSKMREPAAPAIETATCGGCGGEVAVDAAGRHDGKYYHRPCMPQGECVACGRKFDADTLLDHEGESVCGDCY